MPASTSSSSRSTSTVAPVGLRRLAWLAPLGAALFTVAWLVLGATSPGYELFGHGISPYSWIAQPVSGLGLGVTGPWMNAAFITGGLLMIAGTSPTVRLWWSRGALARTSSIALAAMGVGMIVCGVFTLESMMLHLLGFLLAVPVPAVGMILAGFVLRREARGLAAAAWGGGILSLALFVVFQLTFDATGSGGNDGIAGLVQRALIVVAMATVSTIAVGASRMPVPSAREQRAAVAR